MVLCNIWYPSYTLLVFFLHNISVKQSFRNFAQSMAVILPCLVQNIETIGHCKKSYKQRVHRVIWVWRCVSDGYHILHKAPVSHKRSQIAKFMGPIWVLSAPCWPHEPCYQGYYLPFREEWVINCAHHCTVTPDHQLNTHGGIKCS